MGARRAQRLRPEIVNVVEEVSKCRLVLRKPLLAEKPGGRGCRPEWR
jgi:hypothetical protein